MFTSGLREKDASVVKLQGICPTVMGKILSFIYTGEIVINQLVVCQLLPAASMLQVPRLKQVTQLWDSLIQSIIIYEMNVGYSSDSGL